MIDLNLSYCNLHAISDVLGCLSSLIKLNLTGNNFIFLPKSIIQLSNLKKFSLSGCTGLRLLPELPLNIERIDAIGCTSLETLSIRPEDGFWPTLNLLNCVKLIENEGYGDVLSTMLDIIYLMTTTRSVCLSLSLSLCLLDSLVRFKHHYYYLYVSETQMVRWSRDSWK